MRKVVQFVVSHPVTVTMVVLALVLLGIISYGKLGVDLFPNLNNPRLFVELTVTDCPPEEIESKYVEGIESTSIRQDDVVGVSSIIKSGAAQITIEYAWKKNMDEAFLDIQKALASYMNNSEIDEFVITQHDPNTAPIMIVGVTHSTITDMAQLRKSTESYVRNEIVRVAGIADVELTGDEVVDLIIETDEYKLNAFGLSTSDISSKIQNANQSVSGGNINEGGTQYLVKGVSMVATLSDFEDLVVGYKSVGASATSSATMAPIYLRDVATISFQNQRPENIVRINGQRAIGLSIYKETQYNTVQAVNGVFDALDDIQAALPQYHFEIITNQGGFIENSIKEVKDTAVIGILLAVIVLFIFLRRIGTTVIVSLSIPISIITTFNLMYFNGQSLNIMSLGGLALGAGMLVDNAIVVVENIVRHHNLGKSTMEAAIAGTSEVAGAVTASTLTTIVVFLPIVYLQGATGELFKDMAWTVTFSLLCSLVVSLIVIPTLYYGLFKGRKKAVLELSEDAASTEITSKDIRFTFYHDFLNKMLNIRGLVILLAIALFVVVVLLLPFVGTEFMPRSESESFTISIKMQDGTRIERTSSVVSSLEHIIYDLVPDSVMVYSHVGSNSGETNSVFEGEHTAVMKVQLHSKSMNVNDLINKISEYTETVPDMEVTYSQDETALSSLLGTDAAPLVVEIKGEDLDVIASLTREVQATIEPMEGIFNISSTVEDGAPEIEIVLDRMLAGQNNISISTVISQIQSQLSGQEAGEFEYEGELRNIVIKVPEKTLSDLMNMSITSGSSQYMLQELATVRETVAPGEIFRRNQSRIGKVTANIRNNYTLDQVAREVRKRTASIDLPANYNISITGQEAQRQESTRSLSLALILSIILVYMVIASQFESLMHPFTIILTIPIALTGAILAFFFTGNTLNAMGVIGIVMLAGIAVNNSILLVDRMNQIYRSGVPRRDAILAAGQQRIRPILMTTLTTILAMLPMALSFGEEAELRSPMALAVIGGLITSTLMSLIVIPCVYDAVEQFKDYVRK